MEFNEQVLVESGTPIILLETGELDGQAEYVSGSGDSSLIFDYIVSEGEYSLDLGYHDSSSIIINGGRLSDFPGTPHCWASLITRNLDRLHQITP